MTSVHRIGCFLVAVGFLSAGCTPAPESARLTTAIPVAPPHVGPGAPEIDDATERTLDRSWAKVNSGQLDAARATAAELTGPTAELLQVQLDLLEDAEPELDRATRLVERYPSWASAWVTTSVLAERLDNEPAALKAAREAASLWPRNRWNERAAELEQRWISDRLERAAEALERKLPARAVAATRSVLAIEGDHLEALKLLVRALLAQDQLEEAQEVLSNLPEGPDTTFLSARLLTYRESWFTAMQTLEELPSSYPGRDELLRTVRSRWRRDNLPRHVQRALSSEDLTRAELAMVLTATAPQLKALPSEPPPLLTDIMDERGRDAILTVTALGLLSADRLEHLFHPSRPVTPDEVRRALTRAAVLLGGSPPRWCEAEDTTDSCVRPPTTGPGVAAMLEQIANLE